MDRHETSDAVAAGRAPVQTADLGELRRKGRLTRGLILSIESTPAACQSAAADALDCVLALEIWPLGEPAYRSRVAQRLPQSVLQQLTIDAPTVPLWIDPADPLTVAVDVDAGPIGGGEAILTPSEAYAGLQGKVFAVDE